MSHGDTSVLTILNVKSDDAGSYVCSVKVNTLIVVSKSIKITTIVIGMLIKEISVTL